jgi:transcriptional regulator, y4mF family
MIFPSGNGVDMQQISNAAQLGQAVRAARKQAGLTQAQVALTAGVGLRFVVDLEAGKPTAQIGKILQVITTLGGRLRLDGWPTPAEGGQR